MMGKKITCPEYNTCRLHNYHRCLVIQENCIVKEAIRKLEYSLKHDDEAVWANVGGMDFDDMQRGAKR